MMKKSRVKGRCVLCTDRWRSGERIVDVPEGRAHSWCAADRRRRSAIYRGEAVPVWTLNEWRPAPKKTDIEVRYSSPLWGGAPG